MKKSIDVSVVLVSYNTEHLLPRCLDQLQSALTGISNEIIIVDNASRDNSVQLIRERYPQCRLIINSVNVGFGRANNQALDGISGRYVLLLNTDAFVEFDTIAKTIAYMDANHDCGILGVRLTSGDGGLQPSARYFPTPWNLFVGRIGLQHILRNVRMVDDLKWPHDAIRKCDWVPGCYYLVRKEVIDAVGLFDPRYFLYFEEVDHCYSTRKAGWSVVFYPFTTVIHLGGESAKADGAVSQTGRQVSAIQMESELLYFRKTRGLPGVLLDVMLTVLAISINGLKRLRKLRSLDDLAAHAKQVLLVLSLFRRTGFGSRPTR